MTDNALLYRVWWVPQIPMPAFYQEVPDLRTAVVVHDTLAAYDLFQYENRVKPDYANVGGIEMWEDGEWVEVDESEYENLS